MPHLSVIERPTRFDERPICRLCGDGGCDECPGVDYDPDLPW